jgi:hypothetical protein
MPVSVFGELLVEQLDLSLGLCSWRMWWSTARRSSSPSSTLANQRIPAALKIANRRCHESLLQHGVNAILEARAFRLEKNEIEKSSNKPQLRMDMRDFVNGPSLSW